MIRLDRVLAALAVIATALGAGTASARSLAEVRNSKVLKLCAHPNALPFASRKGERHGVQVELGEALAKELGVALQVDWIVASFHAGRAGCDILLDAIADEAVQEERRIKLSRPYRQSGVALAYRLGAAPMASYADLKPGQRVGALIGSAASVYLGRRGIQTIPFAFEDEMIEALGKGEIEAALASPATIGFHNLARPEVAVAWAPAYRGVPELRWNVAAGLRKADAAMVAAVDAGLEALVASGAMQSIHARYGIPYEAPAPE